MTDSLLEITWTDPETDIKGYVVIDRLIRGLASGGLRLRAGCTLAEVRGLAQGMSRKEAIVYDPADHYVPLGGGKGGIDIDPADPRAVDVLTRFMTAVLPVVKEQWNTGEDFGLHQETLEKVAASLGLPSTVEAVFRVLPDAAVARKHLAEAFAVHVGGISLGDLVGGYGVARACLEVAARLGLGSAPTAVVQGFGSIGGAAARYLAAGGVKVIAVADRDGLMVDPDGLDIEAMLASRDSLGVVDRSVLGASVQHRDRDDWLSVPCDILVPAAMSYVIDADSALRVNAHVVVEGANMPTLPEAEEALIDRGIPVIPDFMANVMTNAWWWWIVFGDIAPTAESSFAKIDAVMARLVSEVFAGAAGGAGAGSGAGACSVDGAGGGTRSPGGVGSVGGSGAGADSAGGAGLSGAGADSAGGVGHSGAGAGSVGGRGAGADSAGGAGHSGAGAGSRDGLTHRQAAQALADRNASALAAL